MYKQQRIRDPLHNLIEFGANEFENALWNVIQTREFQRLRRVKQLGFSDLVYPGATHTRFAHSVGVFHTARHLMNISKEHLDKRRQYSDSQAQRALAATLVHDLGHGPFSHAFEDVGQRLGLTMASHEKVSDTLIRNSEVTRALNKLGSGFANDTAEIIKLERPNSIYHAAVSSQFDADRLDYMQRDRLMTGTHHGMIDFRWLIANLEIGEVSHGVDEREVGKIETFVLGPKAVYAAEAYVLGLFQLYPTVYFHKATRGAEKIFSEMLMRLFQLINDGSSTKVGLPAKHPLIRFAKQPDKVENALDLDDTVVWGSLPMLAEAKDDALCKLALRLRDRKLYKSMNIRELIRSTANPKILADDPKAVDKACAGVEQKLRIWSKEQSSTLPRILIDKAEREPYKRFQESKGPLNQIMIRTDDNKLIDLGEKSKAVAAIEKFQLLRVYVSDEDNHARQYIEQVVSEEVSNVTGARAQ